MARIRISFVGLIALVASLAVAAPVKGDAEARPGWFDYDRAAKYEAVVEKDVMVPVRDGTELACDLYRPGRGVEPARGRFPALVADFSPYGKEALASLDTTGFIYFAEHGYVVLKCDVRGSGQSPGAFDPLSDLEAQDNYDVIEWLARRPFVNGRVAQYGGSYAGVSSYRVAALRPPHLVTIVPLFAYQDWYRDWIYLGGMRNVDSRQVFGVFNATTQARAAHLEQEWNQHRLYDDYWQERSVMASRHRIRVPVLGFGGWADHFPDGMVQNNSALGKRHWLVMGPWEHMDLHTQKVEPMNWNLLLAWFDRWLLELPDAPLPARFTLYEMPALDGAWTEYKQWPPPKARELRLHFNADNALGERPGDAGEESYVVNPVDPTAGGWKGGLTPWEPTGEQRFQDEGRLSFTSAPLEKDLVIAGNVRVNLQASLDGEDASLVAKLLDVSPDGSSSWVSTGWLKASHRLSHSTETLILPGQKTTFPIDIWATNWRFRAGHSLRLVIASGDLPRIEPDVTSRMVTVLTGRGGSYADITAIP